MTCFCLATTHDRRGGRWCTPLVQRVCHGTTSGPLPARIAPLASSHPMSSQNVPCLPPLASLCLRLHSLPRPGNMPNTPHRTAPHLPCSPDEMICTRPPICRGRSAAPPARSLSLNFGGGTHIMGPAARARGAAGPRPRIRGRARTRTQQHSMTSVLALLLFATATALQLPLRAPLPVALDHSQNYHRESRSLFNVAVNVDQNPGLHT